MLLKLCMFEERTLNVAVQTLCKPDELIYSVNTPVDKYLYEQ